MELRDIVRRVILSEKGSRLSALNQYFLEVDQKASKPEIKKAVEDFFNVTVTAVNVQNYGGKKRTLRNRRVVQAPDWKRAIVTLKAGDKIDLL